jgi:hypothetical protein
MHNEELCVLTKYCLGENKKKYGLSCSMYGGEVHTEFWWGDHLGIPGINGGIILK